MKNLIKSLFCKHKDKVHVFSFKGKYIQTAGSLKVKCVTRYDIFKEIKCANCNKTITKNQKIKSNATWQYITINFK